MLSRVVKAATLMSTEKLSCVTLKHGTRATVTVVLQGAHVSAWTTEAGHSPIYMSPTAVFAEGKALRGGVPICFPQFSDMGPLAQAHGVARNHLWELVEKAEGGEASTAVFSFKPTDAELVKALAGLVPQFTVRIAGEQLSMDLKMTNVGAETAKFTAALHTYFSVSDIAKLRISGVLDTCRFADNLQARKMCDPAKIAEIDKEVDRIYQAAAGGPVVLHDAGTGVSLEISQRGFQDVVLWNPWIEKAKRLADLPDDGYTKFVCVEAAAALTPLFVAPGESVVGGQTIVVHGPKKATL